MTRAANCVLGQWSQPIKNRQVTAVEIKKKDVFIILKKKNEYFFIYTGRFTNNDFLIENTFVL